MLLLCMRTTIVCVKILSSLRYYQALLHTQLKAQVKTNFECFFSSYIATGPTGWVRSSKCFFLSAVDICTGFTCQVSSVLCISAPQSQASSHHAPLFGSASDKRCCWMHKTATMRLTGLGTAKIRGSAEIKACGFTNGGILECKWFAHSSF